MNYSPVNSPEDYSPLLDYSAETRYIFEEFLMLLVEEKQL